MLSSFVTINHFPILKNLRVLLCHYLLVLNATQSIPGEDGAMYVCPECAHEWNDAEPTTDSDELIVKDAHMVIY